MLLTKSYSEQLEKPEPKTLTNVPGLDVDVRIRPLTGMQRVEFYSKASDKAAGIEDEMVSGFIRMVVLVLDSVIDQAGDVVYTMDDFDHVASLNQSALVYISHQASLINGFDTEELEGNS